jgi:hypothetical protein
MRGRGMRRRELLDSLRPLSLRLRRTDCARSTDRPSAESREGRAAAVRPPASARRRDREAVGTVRGGSRRCQRTCAREGCDVVFTPTPGQLRRGIGRYHSAECANLAKRLHPVPQERECARPGCSQRFVPDAHKAAHGRGRYCTRRCRDADRWRFSRARVPITCAHCREEKIVKSPYYIGRQQFCSRRCWGLYRWRPGGGLETLAKVIEGCRGDIRRKLKLRLAPKPGAPSKYHPDTPTLVRKLRDEGLSWSEIQEETGVPKDTARHMAGARQKRS